MEDTLSRYIRKIIIVETLSTPRIKYLGKLAGHDSNFVRLNPYSPFRDIYSAINNAFNYIGGLNKFEAGTTNSEILLGKNDIKEIRPLKESEIEELSRKYED